MQRSGCWGNVAGFLESITASSLRDARKSPNIPGFEVLKGKSRSCATTACKPGLHSRWDDDYDTVASIEATVDFALESKFHLRRIQHPDAPSGKPLYSMLGRITDCCTTKNGGCIRNTASTRRHSSPH